MTPDDFSERGLVEGPTLALLRQLGYETANGYTELFGPDHAYAGGLGRDDQSQVVLHHRLRPKLASLNADVPPAGIGAAIDELMLDRSAMDPTRANQAVWKLLRDGAKVTVADDRGGRETKTVRFIDWLVPANNEFLAVQPVLGRRSAAHPSLRHRLLRQRHPAGAARAEGVAQVRRAGVLEEPARLPRHDPAALHAERVGRALERLGDEGRRDVRAVGALRRVEAGRRRVRARRRLAGDGDPGRVCEPGRLLDMVENFVAYFERPGRADEGTGPEPSGARRERGDPGAAR